MRRIMVCLAALAGLTVVAATDSVFENSKGAKIPYNSKGTVVRGEWTSQLDKTMKQAASEGVPVLVFWANNGCGHCAATEVELCTKTFTSWQKKYQIYMVFACGGYPGPAKNESDVAKEVARDKSGEFPYIGVYWGTGSSNTYKGKSYNNKQRGTFTGNGLDAATFIKKTEALLPGYTPAIGGWFKKLDESDGNRYEAEPSTKKVTLTMVRASDKKSAVGTDSVKLYRNKVSDSNLVKTYTVNWTKGATKLDLAVAIPSGLKDGDELIAVINGESKAKYRNTIYFVDKENGAGNPRWKGAEFGEWTADIDAAKALVKSKAAAVVSDGKAAAVAATKAYTLVSVQGSLWCHDCANTDRNFLDLKDDKGNNRFRAWAKSKNVALVAMDIPSYTGPTYKDRATPTLFSKDAYKTTLAFENKQYGIYDVSKGGAPAKLTNAVLRSGFGYMTRKGISDSEGLATLKKFHDLAYKTPEQGGFHLFYGADDLRNEDGNANRTGVPIFVLLRSDGTIAARFTRFAAVSPLKADRNNFDKFIKRFDEMLAIADAEAGTVDANEISNNVPSSKTTELPVGTRAAASGRLCTADMRDTFKLTNFKGAADVVVKLSGSSSAEVEAQFMIEKGGALEAVGDPITTKINAETELLGEFDDVGTCYLRIAGKDITSAAFTPASSTANHFAEFWLVASVASLNPQESKASVPVSAGDRLYIVVSENRVYRITGIVGDPVPEGLVEIVNGMYGAEMNGDVEIEAAADGVIEFQEWVPSTVAFNNNEPKDGVGESKGKWTVKVLRSGGVSGAVSATVSVDVEKSTFYYDHDTKMLPRFSIDGVWGFESKTLRWKDGDSAAKSLVIELEKDAELSKYFGDGQITLKLDNLASDADDAVLGKSSYTLKVKDESDKAQSTISIAGTAPAATFDSTIYARRGAGVSLTLRRSNDGVALANSIGLKSSVDSVEFSGDAVATRVRWEGDDYGDKTVTATGLPSAGKTTTLSLSATRSSFKAGSPKEYTVVSVDNKAPAFKTDKVAQIKMVTYSACSAAVEFDPNYIEAGDVLSVELLKGALPDGLTAKVSGQKLKFAGLPKKAGAFTAYFRACATRGGKLVKGMPVKVTFRIVDPTTVKASDKTYGKLANEAVKTTRSLTSLIVMSGGDPMRLAGTLDVTIPKTGKLSAKYICGGGTVTFESKYWDAKNLSDSDGTLTATLTPSKAGYGLTVKALSNGRVLAIVTDKAFKDQELGAASLGKVWSSSNSAKSWVGVYNGALVPSGTPYYLGDGAYGTFSGDVVQPENEEFDAPVGYGYVSLKLTSSGASTGKMTWAGRLPNGQVVSGSAVLSKGASKWVGRAGYAYLPIFKSVSGDRISVVAEIKSGAATAANGGNRSLLGCPDLSPVLPLGTWTHKGEGGTGFGMDIHLMGGLYDSKKSLKDCCKESAMNPAQLKLQVEVPAKAGYDRYEGRGKAKAVPVQTVAVGNNAITVKNATNKFKLEIDRETGVLTGSLRFNYTVGGSAGGSIDAAISGVLLTGWSSECDCSEGSDVQMPFICGALTFDDTVSYKDGNSTKKVGVLSGGRIYSGNAFPKQ
ncbi:MAG: hypothetical protein J6T51_06700 [Kiritimatiellae bacterium]|nr:hypothetical protein [Kiritimatiellia bacterium]